MDSSFLESALVTNHNPTITPHLYVANSLERTDSQNSYTDHWQASGRHIVNQKNQQAQFFVNWLSQQIASDQQVKLILDLGCGDGNHIRFLLDAFPDAHIVALDYSDSVYLGQEEYKSSRNLTILKADARCMPFKDSTFDLVVAYGSINCMPRPTDAVNEVYRILKPSCDFAVWGFATSAMLWRLISLDRNIYQLLKYPILRRIWLYLHLPLFIVVRNSTNINLLNSSLSDCLEIISTNFAPEFLWPLNPRKGWSPLVSTLAFTLISTWKSGPPVGQFFKRV